MTFADNRCETLTERGLVQAPTVEDAAQGSLEKLRDYGWEPESDRLHASHYVVAPTAIAVKYANLQGRFSVERRLCGSSIVSVDEDGHPQPVPPEELARIFASLPAARRRAQTWTAIRGTRRAISFRSRPEASRTALAGRATRGGRDAAWIPAARAGRSETVPTNPGTRDEAAVDILA